MQSWQLGGPLPSTPLDDEAMEALREGHEIHRGLVAEFIGDAHQSARLGLPVYKIGGGPGFIWGASFDDFGKGSLRLSAVDATGVPSPQTQPSTPVQPPLSYTAPSQPTPAPSQLTPAPAEPSAEDLARREHARAERLDKIVQAATKQLNYVAQFIRIIRRIRKSLTTSTKPPRLRLLSRRASPTTSSESRRRYRPSWPEIRTISSSTQSERRSKRSLRRSI